MRSLDLDRRAFAPGGRPRLPLEGAKRAVSLPQAVRKGAQQGGDHHLHDSRVDEDEGRGTPVVSAARTMPADAQTSTEERSTGRKIRVVVAKPGLDGHDRGAKIIARALRDAGMEVIYTGLHQTPEQIVETVLQEDAHAVGLSILSGAHMTLVPKISDLLKAEGAEDVVLVVGGTIPTDDVAELKELGVAEIFTPGSSVQEIIDFIEKSVTP